MTRQELLQSPAYWEQKAQLDIYQHAIDFMESHSMNRTQFAEYLGVSKSYVTQLLSGDYNYSLQKLVDLSMKLGLVLQLEFSPISQILFSDVISHVESQRTNAEFSLKFNFIYPKTA